MWAFHHPHPRASSGVGWERTGGFVFNADGSLYDAGGRAWLHDSDELVRGYQHYVEDPLIGYVFGMQPLTCIHRWWAADRAARPAGEPRRR